MSQVRTRAPDPSAPLRLVGAGLRRLPGAGPAGRAVGGALDRITAMSPRGRRMAVYAGAGVLGVAGVVEWPVALTGAAVAWLTRPGPQDEPPAAADRGRASPQDGRTAAADDTRPRPGPAEHQGPGDRLSPAHFRPDDPRPAVREEPAKVGDPATASGLRRVAQAGAHHAQAPPRPDRPRH